VALSYDMKFWWVFSIFIEILGEKKCDYDKKKIKKFIKRLLLEP
jgi:hypothetical protein